jgi:hypothetical protein
LLLLLLLAAQSGVHGIGLLPLHGQSTKVESEFTVL